MGGLYRRDMAGARHGFSAQTCVIARILGGAGYAVTLPGFRRARSFAPRIKRGDGAPRGASVFRLAAFPFGERGRLSALHRDVFLTAPGRAFRLSVSPCLRLGDSDPFWAAASSEPRASLNGPPSASSWQGTVVSPGGAPAPPGCRRSVRLLPAGAASDPTFMTPHDSALGGSDDLEFIPRLRRDYGRR
jgi:hypothetical protein